MMQRAARRSVPAPFRGPPLPPRVAVVIDPAGGGVHRGVASGIRRAAAALSEAGYEVEEAEPPAVAEVAALWTSIIWTDVRRLWPALKPVVGPDAAMFIKAAWTTTLPLTWAATPTAGARARLSLGNGHASWRSVRWSSGLSAPAPLSQSGPTWPIPSPSYGLWPSLPVPAAFLCRLPPSPSVLTAGYRRESIIGPRFREDIVLDAAEAIEERLGVLTPIDPAGLEHADCSIRGAHRSH